ncbi:hypothetical protein AX769_22380 (plasmid) [Frondihabitans sp. PAMC 28766]|uniref:sugar phosphate isomerase/epimerase family protein n=1 Tax=Frondihabitans sp. PAMC 28766 TaxID=1795630 RepID=UPI00078DA751|nr:sugar phosphate isomerase/epimerase [Frondihabitans sp. PAMC 28766]AMM22875.1 hypothetical protein AX769_22380 [Frondihabitans sp. PAMC 28766]
MTIIGAQGFTLRAEFAELGPAEVFRRLDGIGYHAIEMSAVPMQEETIREIEKVRCEITLDIAAMSVAPGDADDLFGVIPDFAHRLRCSRLRIGAPPFSALESNETVNDFCRSIERAALRLADQGISLNYHNHDFDFAKYGESSLLDRIVEKSPHVGIELDVYWAHRGGYDPIDMIRKYAGRIDLVHLKDVSIRRVGNSFFDAVRHIEADGPDEAAARHHISAELRDLARFSEVGEGTLDFPAIIRAAVDVGATYLFVEQDETYDKTPFESLQISHDNIAHMGFAELF